MTKRLDREITSRGDPLAGTVTVAKKPYPIDNAEEVTGRIINELLSKPEIQALISGLTNDDIRASIMLIVRLLSSRFLSNMSDAARPREAFSGDSDLIKPGILEAVLLGPGKVYAEDMTDYPVLLNLFHAPTPAGRPTYLLQYYLLSLVGRFGRYVPWRNVSRALKAMGFPTDALIASRNRLIAATLLYSPEVETEFEAITWSVDNLRISEAGRFYLEYLSSDPDYAYQVAYDVPLPHTRFSNPARGLRYGERIWSVYELTLAVLQEEETRLNQLAKEPQRGAEMLAALRSRGTLSACLLTVLRRKLESGVHGQSSDARAAASEILKDFEELGIEARIGELARLVADAGAPSGRSVAVRRFKKEIADLGLLEVTIPSDPVAGRGDQLKVTLRPATTNRSPNLVAIVGLDGSRELTHELLHLEWNGSEAVAQATFRAEAGSAPVKSVSMQLVDGVQSIASYRFPVES